jgi:hypothetical protein
MEVMPVNDEWQPSFLLHLSNSTPRVDILHLGQAVAAGACAPRLAFVSRVVQGVYTPPVPLCKCLLLLHAVLAALQ